jgi:hypothetical protein
MFFKTPRNPANEKTPYESLRDSLLASVATLRFVRQTSDIPIPHIYMFFSEGPDVLKLNRPWMIIERMAGERLTNVMADMNLDRLSKIGEQLGSLYSQLIDNQLPSIGSLRSFAKGTKIDVGPVCSDPNGNFMSINYYRRRDRLGLVQFAQKSYDTVPEYFLRTANYAILSLINQLKNIRSPTNARDSQPVKYDFWNIWQYVHIRHLHLFFPEFVVTPLLSNFFTLDTTAFNLDNIHVDDQYNICGVIDWDGINVKPVHLAMQLPRPLEVTKSYWIGSSRRQRHYIWTIHGS